MRDFGQAPTPDAIDVTPFKPGLWARALTNVSWMEAGGLYPIYESSGKPWVGGVLIETLTASEIEVVKQRWVLIILYNKARVGAGYALEAHRHAIEELGEIPEVVESGPSWYAISSIEVKHNRPTTESKTVEEAAGE